MFIRLQEIPDGKKDFKMSEFILTPKEAGELLSELYTLRAENKLLKERFDLSQRVSAIERFCDDVESNETAMEAEQIELREALKNANSFDDFKMNFLKKG